MPTPIVLASGSQIRQTLLRNAGIDFETALPRVDEDSLRASMMAEQANPRDIADALAEAKAAKIAAKRPDALVLGCDQVLEHRGQILSKPETPEQAVAQITALSGDRHRLLSAVVAYEEGAPVWRHVGTVRLSMRLLSEEYIEDYVARNFDSIRHAVGGYKLEEEGARFFTQIEGDYFTVLGLPLLPLLSWLILRGNLAA